MSLRQNRLQHIDPKFVCIIATLLPHSVGLLNRGHEGPNPLSGTGSHYGILSPIATGTRTVTATRTELCLPRTSTNWLTKPSVAPGYIIVWRPPAPWGHPICTEFNHVHRSRLYLRLDAPASVAPLLIYIGASLNWRFGLGSICYKVSYLYIYVKLYYELSCRSLCIRTQQLGSRCESAGNVCIWVKDFFVK